MKGMNNVLLAPGQSRELSRCGATRIVMELSLDGQTLTIVRENASGSEVITSQSVRK